MSKWLPVSGWRGFLTIWLGQVFSQFGTRLTAFAIGWWIFQRTESVTSYTVTLLIPSLAGILATPLLGVWVDRWSRRKAMAVGDVVSGVSTVAVLGLMHFDLLEIWSLCAILAVSSVSSILQGLAFTSSITMLVPKKDFARAAGLGAISNGVTRIAAPMLAGGLVSTVGAEGVLTVDLATFFIAILALTAVRVPRPAPSGEGGRASGRSTLREAWAGWKALSKRPSLIDLLIFSAAVGFFQQLAVSMFMPLLLGFASPSAAGFVMTAGGVGALLGGVAMSSWGGPKRRMNGVLGFSSLIGLFLVLGGLLPSVPLIAFAAVGILFSSAVMGGCFQAIWQSKIPPDLQGRVFATQSVILWSTEPLAYGISGPLADFVFEPLMAVGGPLSGSLGLVMGTGPGRGIGLIGVICGILIMAISAIGALSSRLRLVEDRVPDAFGDHAPEAGQKNPVPSEADLETAQDQPADRLKGQPQCG